MLLTFVVAKCPVLCFTSLWSQSGLVWVLIIFWKRGLCLVRNTIAKLSASFQQWAARVLYHLLTTSVQFCILIHHTMCSPTKTRLLSTLSVLAEAVFRSWKISTALFPGLPPIRASEFFPSMYMYVCVKI